MAGCRRRRGASGLRIRVNGLVTRRVIRRSEPAIFPRFDDIWRQGQFADARGQERDRIAGRQIKTYAVFALFHFDYDGLASIDEEAGFIGSALARPQHAPPFGRFGRRAE